MMGLFTPFFHHSIKGVTSPRSPRAVEKEAPVGYGIKNRLKEGRMALMDDLKKKTEEGLKTLRETAESIAFNVEKQAKIATKKMDTMKIQRKIQKLYAEVGEYVYGEYALERPLTLESPFLKERMATISQMKAEIREIEDEIAELRRMEPVKGEDKPGEGQ
jgi:hypothetical protein